MKLGSYSPRALRRLTLSLSIIGAFLGVGILASLIFPTHDHDGLRSPVEREMEKLLRVGQGFARKCLALVGGSALGGLPTHFLWARRLMGMINGGRG